MFTRSRFQARAIGALVTFAILVCSALPVSAQNAAALIAQRPMPADAKQKQPDDTPETGPQARHILTDIVQDQRDIWTSPFHVGKSDMKWLLPSLGITAGLIATDKYVNEETVEAPGAVGSSNHISDIGSGGVLFGTAGAFYLTGRIVHNERARATGLLGIEALIDETIVVTALKQATNRERPDKNNGHTHFYDGGSAFPSGHAAASWALAAVVGEQYRDKPLVRWTAYGLATAVSVARVTAERHSPSDVFVGGLIGYLIGRHVAHRGGAEAGHASFNFAPIVNIPTRTYGVAGSFQF